MPQLAALTNAAWWTTNVVDLNVCDFKHESGPLTEEQRRGFADGEYAFWLFGNDRIRLVLIPDPCYQTQYGGSNAFLLYRNAGKVFATQVLDGYFSRADNSVGWLSPYSSRKTSSRSQRALVALIRVPQTITSRSIHRQTMLFQKSCFTKLVDRRTRSHQHSC